MRRKDREITDLEGKLKILRESRVMSVAMCDGNKPYVVPMNYGFEAKDGEIALYFHSALEGRKLDLIEKNPNVCVELNCANELIEGANACAYGYRFRSVIAEGRAEILSDVNEKIVGLKALMRQQTGRDFEFGEKEALSVAVVKITVTELSAKEHK